MSADVRWTVVLNDLPKIAARFADTGAKLVAKAALDIEAQAKVRAAVDTGALKNSIQAIKKGPMSWWVVVGQEYGAYVEYGTIHSAPQPFFNPAINLVAPEFYKSWKMLVSAG